ncbi:MAG: PDDEXK nuclease domain-containing protein [Candidatus Paracaedibacter sp.]
MVKKLKKIQKSTLPHNQEQKAIETLYHRVSEYLQDARQRVVQSVNLEMVKAYWLIGRDIVEEEQKGKARADYGKELIEKLSERLLHEFGKGYSISNLRNMRQFYLTYQNQIHQTLSGEFIFQPTLSWSTYCLLIKITSEIARNFYEIEATQNCWSSRELERQINSLLFERLAKSRDKEGLLRLARKGQEINHPIDAIKDPVILEFLGFPASHQLTETKLEDALISNLQNFLLELGKGFAFVARQKRLTLEGDHFYTDLVFYHTILKCYVIIDLKTGKLTHADLGQMQLYVNYFDQECRTEGDKPTIGLILCTEKNDTVVKYTLGENSKQIFASKYQPFFPTEQELEAEMKRGLKDIQYQLHKKDQNS